MTTAVPTPSGRALKKTVNMHLAAPASALSLRLIGPGGWAFPLERLDTTRDYIADKPLAAFTSRSTSDGTKPDGPLGCPYL